MDGLILSALVEEWQSFIGSRIEKIHQPAERDLIVTLRGSAFGTIRWLLSAHRNFYRAHQIRGQRPANPETPPMFCMLARKYMEGGRIAGIRQQGWDRVLEIYVDGYDDLGDPVQTALVLELMGRHSNLIICAVEDGQPTRIIDSIIRVTPDMSRIRPILPGLTYSKPPAQKKQTVAELTNNPLADTELTQLDWSGDVNKLSKQLPKYIAGVGPVTAKEALNRSQSSPEAVGLSPIVTSLRNLFAVVQNKQEKPCLGLDEFGRISSYGPFHLSSCAQTEDCASLDEAIEEYFRDISIRKRTGAIHSELTAKLNEGIDRLQAKLSRITRELQRGEGHNEDRIRGELLTSFAHDVEKGQTETSLPNFYDNNSMLTIELNPAKNAIENAQTYFKRARKRKRALSLLVSEEEAVQRDLQYLESCLVIAQDATAEDVEQLQEELVAQGFLKPPRKRKKPAVKRTGKPAAAEQFISTDGLPMFVGRNNMQNDQITFRSSQPHDIWFHVKDQPGSHVVVRTSGKEVPQTTLDEAATLAAYYSKGRESSNVAVDYTQIRNVWKPNGARPGFALYKEQTTLYVTPDRGVVKGLARPSAN